MELIATVKLKKYRNTLENDTDYADKLFVIVSELLKADEKETLKNILLKSDDNEHILYVVITSNLGLCSVYNSNIYKTIDDIFDKDKDTLIVYGQRGLSHFRNTGYNILNNYVDLGNTIDEHDAILLCEFLIKQFKTGKFKSIKLVYTHYVNSIKFEPVIFQVLPFNIDENSKIGEYKGYPPIIEPNIIEVFKELFPLYISSIVYKKILESQVSEQASRRTAMDAANDNAEDLLNNLTREYNTSRQNAITREITEVVSAANAQK